MCLSISTPTIGHAPSHHRFPSARSQHLHHRQPHAAATPASTSYATTNPPATTRSYTDRKGLLLHFQTDDASPPSSNGIAQHAAESTLFLTAELRLLANAASDRAEMHSILAQQRDNWNDLFQRTLTSASLTACLLSALATHSGNVLGLSLPALLLNAGTAAMMAVINHFQPSQLAEEQRTAARLFRKLANDVHYALSVSPHLRQSTALFCDRCKRCLSALDKAFPMPLTPGGLDKFPAKVVPPCLIEPQPTHGDGMVPLARVHASDGSINGWNHHLIHDLKHVAAALHRSDIPKYIAWAQSLVQVNKCLAIAAPCFAASAALLNIISITSAGNLGMWAAICGVTAMFMNSLSNDMQLGMVFELYRNSAGYYADVETTIKDTLRMPAQHRENGALFRQRIAYQLGRWPASDAESLMPADAKDAGTLF